MNETTSGGPPISERIPRDFWKLGFTFAWSLLAAGFALYLALVKDVVRESELGEVLKLNGVVTVETLRAELGRQSLYPYYTTDAIVLRERVERRLSELEGHSSSTREHMPIEEKLATFPTRPEFEALSEDVSEMKTLLTRIEVMVGVGARKFGNVLDPNSSVAKILRTKRVFVLKEDAGTLPRFFYYFDERHHREVENGGEV